MILNKFGEYSEFPYWILLYNTSSNHPLRGTPFLKDLPMEQPRTPFEIVPQFHKLPLIISDKQFHNHACMHDINDFMPTHRRALASPWLHLASVCA